MVVVPGVLPISLSENGSLASSCMRAFRLLAERASVPLFCTEPVPMFCPGGRDRGISGLPTAAKISLPREGVEEDISRRGCIEELIC